MNFAATSRRRRKPLGRDGWLFVLGGLLMALAMATQANAFWGGIGTGSGGGSVGTLDTFYAQRHSGGGDGDPHVDCRVATGIGQCLLLRATGRWGRCRQLPDPGIAHDPPDLHRHRVDQGAALHLHGDGDLADLDRDQLTTSCQCPVRGDEQARARRGEPRQCRNRRQPDDHRRGCGRQHGRRTTPALTT